MEKGREHLFGTFSALLELGESGVMVTKGSKGVTPQRPAQSLGEIDRLTVVDDRLFIERVVVDVPELGGGTTGETVFDVFVNGASIYPSSGIDDQRPRFPAGSGPAVHEGGIPELLELRRGDEVVLITTAHADLSPASGKLQLLSWSG